MGFFLKESDKRPAATKGRTTASSKKLDPSIRGCDTCSLRRLWPRLNTPRMRLSGAADADVLVVGEAPGEVEDKQGKAFVGPTGTLLRNALPGRSAERCAFTNAVRCRPLEGENDNRQPTAAEIHNCSLYLEEDVAALPKLKAILGVGGVPLSHFVQGGRFNITAMHGSRFPVRIGGRTLWYYPIFHPSFIARMASKRKHEDSPAYPVFQADIKYFFNRLDYWSEPEIDADLTSQSITLAYTEEEARAVIARFKAVPRGIDVETANMRTRRGVLKPMEKDAGLLMASVSDGDMTVAFPIHHPDAMNDWGLPLLLEIAANDPWVAHNAGFELAWLIHYARIHGGIKSYDVAAMHDSMVLVRIYHQHERLLSLEAATRIHLGVNVKQVLDINADRLLEYPLHETLRYNGLDAKACARLFQKLHKKVSVADYQSLIDSTYSTTMMMLAGLPTNQEAARDLHAIWDAKEQDAEERALSYYEVKAYMRDTGKKWNIASTDDVGHVLVKYGKADLPLTKEGSYKTDEAQLKPLVDDGSLLAQAVLDHRQATKMKAPYIASVREVIDRYVDALLHPGYNVTLVSTYRLSGDDPNQQNWPNRDAAERELRKMIEAGAGHMFYAFDQAQLEVRVECWASRDRRLIEDLLTSFDMHSFWRDRFIKEHPPYLDYLSQKTKETDRAKLLKVGRTLIKSDFVFASLYGSIAESVSERTGVPLEIVKALMKELWQRYPQVLDWIKARHREYKDNGCIRNLVGAVRRGIFSGNEPINTPIQSTAARIVNDQMNDCCALARKERDIYFLPRMNIHDDLTFILPEDIDAADSYVQEITKIMTKVRYDFQIVPLVVEAKCGASWYDLEEFAKVTGDYVR